MAKDVICVLPEGYRPSKNAFCPFVKNGNTYGTIIINSNGNITLDAISSTTTTGRVYFNAIYFLP